MKGEGRRKKEEGGRKKEEGRRKKEEGGRKKGEGRGLTFNCSLVPNPKTSAHQKYLIINP
ncbi:MAG: hypothetical protein ACRCT1_05905 [Microcoleaceae cyanobacterium]|jgi:hypothetical protein